MLALLSELFRATVRFFSITFEQKVLILELGLRGHPAVISYYQPAESAVGQRLSRGKLWLETI